MVKKIEHLYLYLDILYKENELLKEKLKKFDAKE